MKSRDDFNLRTKEIIAKRVGYICSNPECRRRTLGPDTNPEKYNNLGKASHVCAASKGGPRFDEKQTIELRKSSNNGIWLCAHCADLIDKDVQYFTVSTLQDWKRIAEEEASKKIGKPKKLNNKEVLDFIRLCLSRPAFEDKFHQERNEKDFMDAVQDTKAAFNTGQLFSRSGRLYLAIDFRDIEAAKRQSRVISSIYGRLKDILSVFNDSKYREDDWHGSETYILRYSSDAEFIDSIRRGIIEEYNDMAKSYGIVEIRNSFI